ncbi:hypothetical protein AB0I77_01565 [Streptomyces sp. NPDC050619]|uniref:hypothetical protein n=1 Tax=Streptomyces sp. NPDC050619 TaxID=3157214 RepID=UPI00342AC02E
MLAACARPGMMRNARPTERHWQRLVEQVTATGTTGWWSAGPGWSARTGSPSSWSNLLEPVPDAANRSLTLAETEMLRNLNKEFRGNGLPAELYSQLVRYGAVMHMKNACPPGPHDVKIATPQWAVGRIGGMGVRVIGDPALLSAVPKPADEVPAEPLIAPEVAAQAPYGALAAAAAAPIRHSVPARARTVHQTPSEELVKVLGHRCLKRLRRR